MGAIFGYLSFKNNPNPELENTMRNPALYWGNDGYFKYLDENILIGLNHRYNTPEAVYETQPYQLFNGDVLFFNGRIDNRPDLLNRFGIKNAVEISDGYLVSICWEKFNEQIVDYVEGDWLIVCWNNQTKKLTLLRDHHGITSIYYHVNSSFFAFSTSIKSLLAINDIPKTPNLLRMAQVLTAWNGNGVDSAYENIFRLPPAHILTIDIKMLPETKRYWYPENNPKTIYKDKEQYYEHFFHLFSNTVKQQLRSYKPIGSQLSGGLDSGSISALAAMHLKSENKRLISLTSVPAYKTDSTQTATRFGDESELAKLTADFTQNMDWISIDSKNINPYETIKQGIEIQSEPFFAAANVYWISELKKTAQQMGLGTILSGQGGNATISWPIQGYKTIMSKPSEIISINNFLNYSGWRHHILPKIVPLQIKNFLSILKKGKFPFLNNSAIHTDFAEKLMLSHLLKVDNVNQHYLKNPSPNIARLQILLLGKNVSGFLLAQSSAWNNIETRDPSVNKSIIEYCLSLPDSVYVSNGKDRLLVRESMKNILPDKVLNNTMRGRQSADIKARLPHFYHSGREILDIIGESKTCQHVLDVKKMENILTLTKNENSKVLDTEIKMILLRGIAVGLFLLNFD